jgi:hypothetical protein
MRGHHPRPAHCPASTIQSLPILPRSAKSQLRLVRRQGGMRKRRPLRHNVGRGSLRRFNLSNFRSVAPKSESLPFLRGNPLMSCGKRRAPQLVPRKHRPRCSRRKAPSRPKDPGGPASLPGPARKIRAGPVRSVAPRPNRPRSVRFAPTPPNWFVCPGPGRYIRDLLRRLKAARLRLAPPRPAGG